MEQAASGRPAPPHASLKQLLSGARCHKTTRRPTPGMIKGRENLGRWRWLVEERRGIWRRHRCLVSGQQRRHLLMIMTPCGNQLRAPSTVLGPRKRAIRWSRLLSEVRYHFASQIFRILQVLYCMRQLRHGRGCAQGKCRQCGRLTKFVPSWPRCPPTHQPRSFLRFQHPPARPCTARVGIYLSLVRSLARARATLSHSDFRSLPREHSFPRPYASFLTHTSRP